MYCEGGGCWGNGGARFESQRGRCALRAQESDAKEDSESLSQGHPKRRSSDDKPVSKPLTGPVAFAACVGLRAIRSTPMAPSEVREDLQLTVESSFEGTSHMDAFLVVGGGQDVDGHHIEYH